MTKNVNFGPTLKVIIFLKPEQKVDWFNSWNVQAFRKNLKANVLQIFAFAFHILGDNIEDKPRWTGKSSHIGTGVPLTMLRVNLIKKAESVISVASK